MKRPSDKAIGIYLIWVLVHFTILITTDQCWYASRIFYPFTKGRYGNNHGSYRNNFVVDTYDITEFVFYTISVIILYYSFSLLGLKRWTITEPNIGDKLNTKKTIGRNCIARHIKRTDSSEWSTQINFVHYLIVLTILSFLLEIFDIFGSKSINLNDFDFGEVGVFIFVFFMFSHILFFIYLSFRFILLKLFQSKKDFKFSFWMPIPYINLFFITLIMLVLLAALNLQ